MFSDEITFPKSNDSNTEIFTGSEKFTLKSALFVLHEDNKRCKIRVMLPQPSLGLNTYRERRHSSPVQIQLRLASVGIPERPASTKMDDAQRASNWAHSAQTSLGPG